MADGSSSLSRSTRRQRGILRLLCWRFVGWRRLDNVRFAGNGNLTPPGVTNGISIHDMTEFNPLALQCTLLLVTVSDEGGLNEDMVSYKTGITPGFFSFSFFGEQGIIDSEYNSFLSQSKL